MKYKASIILWEYDNNIYKIEKKEDKILNSNDLNIMINNIYDLFKDNIIDENIDYNIKINKDSKEIASFFIRDCLYNGMVNKEKIIGTVKYFENINKEINDNSDNGGYIFGGDLNEILSLKRSGYEVGNRILLFKNKDEQYLMIMFNKYLKGSIGVYENLGGEEVIYENNIKDYDFINEYYINNVKWKLKFEGQSFYNENAKKKDWELIFKNAKESIESNNKEFLESMDCYKWIKGSEINKYLKGYEKKSREIYLEKEKGLIFKYIYENEKGKKLYFLNCNITDEYWIFKENFNRRSADYFMEKWDKMKKDKEMKNNINKKERNKNVKI
jgi:hypothetical protein